MYPACFRTGYIFLFPLYKMFSCVIIKVSNPHLKWGLLTLIYKFYDIRYNDDIEVELKFDLLTPRIALRLHNPKTPQIRTFF